MDLILWAAAVAAAAVLLLAGAEKLLLSESSLHAKRPWTQGAPTPAVRVLGALEVAGALGLVLPRLTGIAPLLVPAAGLGVAILMLGAIATELRHRNAGAAALPALMLVLVLVVAVGRAGMGTA